MGRFRAIRNDPNPSLVELVTRLATSAADGRGAMGLMEWFRAGGSGKSGTAMTAALGEIDGIFRPARKEQLTLIEEQKRRRLDVQTGDDVDVDLERGVAVVRLTRDTTAPGAPVEERAES